MAASTALFAFLTRLCASILVIPGPVIPKATGVSYSNAKSAILRDACCATI